MKFRTTTFKHTLRFAFTGLMALGLLSSCKKDDPYDFNNTIAANVNFINTNVTAGPAVLYVEDILRTPNAVSYGQASGYNKTYLGDQDVEVRSAGGTETSLVSAHSQFDANESYTFFLVTEGTGAGIISVKDDATASATGKAKVRFVNASTGAAVSAAVAGVSLTSSAAQSFKYVGGVIEVPAAQSTITITSGATTVSMAKLLESGKSYTVYAEGAAGGSGTNVLKADIFTNK